MLLLRVLTLVLGVVAYAESEGEDTDNVIKEALDTVSDLGKETSNTEMQSDEVSVDNAPEQDGKHEETVNSQAVPDTNQPVSVKHLSTFMGTGSSLDTISFAIPNHITVACNTFPDLNGRYSLHSSGMWNERCVWYKDTTAILYFSNDGKWTLSRRNPVKTIVTASVVDPNNVYVPPKSGWRIPLTLVFTGLDVLPDDLSFMFHPLGRWDVRGQTIEIEDTATDDNQPEGMGYRYVDKDGAYPLLFATLRPPLETTGFITATWVVMHPKGEFYLTMVSRDTLHIMDNEGVIAAAEPVASSIEEEADTIARDILKQLFSNHFSKPSIEKVTGCSDSPLKGKTQTTSKCSIGKPTELTITGQNFGKADAQVWLLKRVGDRKVEVTCGNVNHDEQTPSQKLTCTLPPLEMGLVLDVVVIAMGTDGEKFESVLYGAVKTETTYKNKVRALNFQDFEELGVGGLGPEFGEMFRRAFASRLQNDAVLEKLGIRHVRGVVMHGPPGTGKTLLARKISEMLGAAQVHTVSGPEIMSKYVGQSESNLRKLFEKASQEAAEDDGLHLIIFDEMDAIMKPRGHGDDSGARAVYDGVTTQLLTLMDGMKDRGNLLVLGLTNRLDAVDPALLRPGRFDVKIKMPLPDEKGRHEIFIILTKVSRESGMMSPDVDLLQLAKDTPSFTGADIEGVIKSATSYALSEVLDTPEGEEQQIRITQNHFRRAMKEVQPSHGSSTAINQYLERGIVHYDESFTDMLNLFDRPVHRVRYGKRNKMLKILIEGEPGSGLTTVASYIAKKSGFPFIHLLGMEDTVGSTESEELVRIREVFENAYLVDRSCIILDKLELLLEGAHGRASSALQHTLHQLLTKKPTGKGKLLVLVTTNSLDTLRYLGINNWDMTATVPYLDKQGMQEVLRETNVFEDLETTRTVISQMPLRIGVKKLLWLIDQARVMHGIDEDIHEVRREYTKEYPFWSGKTQYIVPTTVGNEESEEAFFEESVENMESAANSKDAEHFARLRQRGFVHPKIFLQLLKETGLHNSEEGIPTATGSLML